MKVFVALIQTSDTQNMPDLVVAADRETLRQRLHAKLVECYDPCPLPATATMDEMTEWFAETDGGLEEDSDGGEYFIWEYEEEI